MDEDRAVGGAEVWSRDRWKPKWCWQGHICSRAVELLCEIETAEHQEQLSAINFNSSNTWKTWPHRHFSPTFIYFHYFPNSVLLFFPNVILFSLSFSPLSVFPFSFFVPLPSLLCWYPTSLLSYTSRVWQLTFRLGSPTTGLHHALVPLPDVTLSSCDRQWGFQSVSQSDRRTHSCNFVHFHLTTNPAKAGCAKTKLSRLFVFRRFQLKAVERVRAWKDASWGGWGVGGGQNKKGDIGGFHKLWLMYLFQNELDCC